MSIGTRLYIQKREVITKGIHVLDELSVNHAQQIMNHFEKNRQLKWQKDASENTRGT